MAVPGTWRAPPGFQDLLTNQLRILKPDHPDTLTTRSNLATCRGQAGDPDAAAALRDLLTNQLRVLGPDHPDTLGTRNNLAFWRRAVGQAEDAV